MENWKIADVFVARWLPAFAPLAALALASCAALPSTDDADGFSVSSSPDPVTGNPRVPGVVPHAIRILPPSHPVAIAAPTGEPHPSPELDWEPRFQGISLLKISRDTPRPLRAIAALVDTDAPGISFVTTPGNGDRAGETDGLRTSSFLRREHCQIAINAAPFDVVHLFEGRPQHIAGLHRHDGVTVSGADKKPALAISKSNRASIRSSPHHSDNYWNAVAGFGIVLRNGKVTGTAKKKHPRTAAGVSRLGRYVILLVIDGRQSGYSEGVTTEELGTLLRELGAWEGINFDGGGTSTFAIENTPGRSQVLNRPVQRGIRGLERIAGSHLGVRARRLSKH